MTDPRIYTAPSATDRAVLEYIYENHSSDDH